VTCKRRAPDAALFIGSGKADEIKQLATELGVQEILFDQSLSPAQQRNLERHLELPVNDRTLLILEIFAQRARSHEGKLTGRTGAAAVPEYTPGAALVAPGAAARRHRHARWPGRNPDRTRPAHDRRQHQAHQGAPGKVKRQRQTQRRQRERRDSFNISLVGYTNAGKSSLFNSLVKARAYAADQLFATLDTTTRQLYLGEAGRIDCRCRIRSASSATCRMD
jgi:GTP-binding protein HflX